MTSDRNSARLFAELVDEDGVSNGVNEDRLVEDLLPCFPTLLAEVDALKVCGAYGQQTAWLQRRKWLRLLEPVSAGRVHVHEGVGDRDDLVDPSLAAGGRFLDLDDEFSAGGVDFDGSRRSVAVFLRHDAGERLIVVVEGDDLDLVLARKQTVAKLVARNFVGRNRTVGVVHIGLGLGGGHLRIRARRWIHRNERQLKVRSRDRCAIVVGDLSRHIDITERLAAAAAEDVATRDP